MQLEAVVDDEDMTTTGKQKLQLIVSIHCLLCVNKFAYGFCPGATQVLMVDTGRVIDEIRARIRSLADEIEKITLSSSSDDEEDPDMANVKVEEE